MLGIGSLVLGGLNTIMGLVGLATQPKAPKYEMSPDMQNVLNQARGMSQRGFTGAERAAMQQQIAQQSQGAFQRGVDLSGGGMAGALSAGLRSANLGAANQMAIQDAALRRQNFATYGNLARESQRIADMNVAQQQRDLMARQQASGGALQSGLSQLGTAGNLYGQQQFMQQNPGLYGLGSTGTGSFTPSNISGSNFSGYANSLFNDMNQGGVGFNLPSNFRLPGQ